MQNMNFTDTIKDYLHMFKQRAELKTQAQQLTKKMKDMEAHIKEHMRQNEIPAVEYADYRIATAKRMTKQPISAKVIGRCNYFDNEQERERFITSLGDAREVTEKVLLSVKDRSK